MTPRNLFIIILRVIGLFFLKDMFYLLLQVISSYYTYSVFEERSNVAGSLIMLGIVLAAGYVVFYYIMFKTGVIIDKLKLDQGFEREEFSFFEQKGENASVDYTSMLSLSILLVAVYIGVTELPNLFFRAVAYIREDRYGADSSIKASSAIVSVVKIILAYVLISLHPQIAAFIENRRRKGIAEEEKKEPGS